MNAEPKRVTTPEAWSEWERKIVNGVFPLRRYLGGSNHSAVFLTEYKAGNLAEAAIKFVPADIVQTEVQLLQWGTAATLSHPNLLRVLDVGRCRFAGRIFLFVVMEYAEQTLAQILPRRPLTPDETRELLLPTLDVLAFLHRNHLVHGQLKPSNFLVVNDQLKLTSDTVRPAGATTSGIVETTMYDPPELRGGVTSAAGDIWGLGVTLVEALTQRTPVWSDDRSETASSPARIPAPFGDTVRRCLSRTPANRPTVAQLETQYKPNKPAQQPQATAISQAPPSTVQVSPPTVQARPPEVPPEIISSLETPKRGVWTPAILAVIVMSLAVLVGIRLLQQQPNTGQSDSSTQETDSLALTDGSADPAPADAAPSDSADLDGAPEDAAPVAPAGTSTVDATGSASSGRADAEAVGAEPTGAARPIAARVPNARATDANAAETRAAEVRAADTHAVGASAGVTTRAADVRTADTHAAGTSVGITTRAADVRAADTHAAAAPATDARAVGPSAVQSTAASAAASAARASAPPATASIATARTASAPTAAARTPVVATTAAARLVPTLAARAASAPPVPTGTTTPSKTASSSVLQEVSPDVPPAIGAKIRGHINVTVRVLVDPSGNVVGEFVERSGPSKYFALRAADAAVEWKFAPTDERGPRVWLLHFEFTEAGVNMDATAAQ